MPEVIINIPQHVNITYEPSIYLNNLETIILKEEVVNHEDKLNFSSDGIEYQLVPAKNQELSNTYTAYCVSLVRQRTKAD